MSIIFDVLPVDTLVEIFTHLDIRSLLNIRCASKKLFIVVDVVWPSLCFRDYHIPLDYFTSNDYENVWSRVHPELCYRTLFKFRDLLRQKYFERVVHPYGGLVKFEPTKRGLEWIDMLPPPDDSHTLVPICADYLVKSEPIKYRPIKDVHIAREMPLFIVVPTACNPQSFHVHCVADLTNPNEAIVETCGCIVEDGVNFQFELEKLSLTDFTDADVSKLYEHINAKKFAGFGAIGPICSKGCIFRTSANNEKLTTEEKLSDVEHLLDFSLSSFGKQSISWPVLLALLREFGDLFDTPHKLMSTITQMFKLRTAKLHVTFVSPKSYKFTPICVVNLTPPPSCKPFSDHLLEPGVYVGTFSIALGMELVLIYYATKNHLGDDGIFMIGRKITGDTNVPATKITFEINVRAVFALDMIEDKMGDHAEMSERHDIDMELYNVTKDVPYDVTSPGFKKQFMPKTFSGFEDIREKIPRYAKPTPKVYTAAFCGVGQVADDGYQDAQFIGCVSICYNRSTMGLFWPLLECFFHLYKLNNVC